MRQLVAAGRTPFREALRMVQVEKLVDILPNGRLMVPELSMEDFTQVQIARISMEAAAARLSIPRLEPENLAHLEGYMAQMSHYVNSDHFDRVEKPHRDFHRGILAHAGETIVLKIDELSDRIGRYRWAYSVELRPAWPNRTAEHRAILDAVNAGDVEEAVTQLVRHYLNAGLLLAEFMEATSGPGGGDRFRDAILVSLAPDVRAAVSRLS
ncbi:GntR family transcriptional regulator [Streptomyces mirabilis]|uniref:GntR family transcriptional regulator n=1 Tax=Streptomyces mirabilis TaxID=68239 RepID=UPI0033CAFAB2